MKRIGFTLIVLAVAGLSFAAGKEAGLKFPYVGEKLNEPCGKTEFEWRCLQGSIIQNPKPIVINSAWDMLHFEAKPQPGGLLVMANLGRRKGNTVQPRKRGWLRSIDSAMTDCYQMTYKRFAKFDPLYVNLEIRLHVDGKLVATKNEKGFTWAKGMEG